MNCAVSVLHRWPEKRTFPSERPYTVFRVSRQANPHPGPSRTARPLGWELQAIGVPPGGGLPALIVSLLSGQALSPRGGGAAPICIPTLSSTGPQRLLHPQLRAQGHPCWPHCLSVGVGWVRPEERQQPRSACVCVHRHVRGRVLACTPQIICQKAAKCTS